MKINNGEVWVVKILSLNNIFDLVYIDGDLNQEECFVMLDTNEVNRETGERYCSDVQLEFVKRVEEAEIY